MKAFSLIELQIGILILLIFVALATSLFQRTAEKEALKTQLEETVFLMEWISRQAAKKTVADWDSSADSSNPFGFDAARFPDFSGYGYRIENSSVEGIRCLLFELKSFSSSTRSWRYCRYDS